MKKFLAPLYALPATALVLCLALIMAIFSHMSAIGTGQEVLVPARGYDPRAILLGHYVSLRPDTSRDVTGELAEQIRDEFEPGEYNSRSEMVWVTLDTGSPDWTITSISQTRPETDSLAMYVDLRFDRNDENSDTLTYNVTPDMNIDRYYANQKQALEIEDKLRDGDEILLIVSIGKDGTPRLKGLQIDGEREIMSWW